MDRPKIFVALFLLVHLFVLVWVAWGLPIGPHEAKLYFQGESPVAKLMELGRTLFPAADFLNIRLPFLFLHLLNLFLYYHLSKLFLDDEKALMLSFIVFLLLPGIVSSAVLASSTGMILALYQGFLILYLRKRHWLAYAVLPLFLLVDRSSVVLYFALLTFALWRRKVKMVAVTTVLFAASLSLYGFDIHGKPVNYFLDTVALYAAIFSPFVFLYFFYAMYRILLKGDRNIVWHVSFVVLALSLTLSLRQKIRIEDFAPFVIVALPQMVRLFFSSFRVRLPEFRRSYRYGAWLVLGTLFLNTLVLLFHKPFFAVLDKPEHHFAAPFYLPYWCAEALKERGIRRIEVPKLTLRYQLRYYGIESGGGKKLSTKPCKGCEIVTIRYKNGPVFSCYVSKINKSSQSSRRLPAQ